MISLVKYFSNLRLKRFEKRMKKLKPDLLLSWYDTQEESIRKEYDDEMERLHDEIQNLKEELKESRKKSDFWKGKYEGVSETQDKINEQLITKIETSSVDKGKLKEQVKQLKDEIQE